MFGSSRKPYSAITVHIDRLTSEQFEEDEIGGIPDLVDVIRLQDSGPTEAARALRKKLKYGNVHRQLRALTIIDGLIQNAGGRFQRTFADEPLLERLRILAKDDMVDKEVRAKVNVLFRQWAAAYKNTPGLERIAVLYKELPRARKPQQVKVLKETEAEAQHDRDEDHESPVSHRFSQASTSVSSSASRPSPVTLSSTTPSSTSSIFRSKDKKNKAKPFNLEKEKPQLLETIAQASVASTNLLNALQLINREHQRVSEEPEAVNRFETCKQLRRQILRYVQLIESDQWIGSLLSANDELVKALTAYEIMDKSIEDDSDSEAEGMSDIRHAARKAAAPPTNDLAGLSLHEHAPAKPPRPGNIPMPASKPPVPDDDDDEEEEDNPFGDSNAITPGMEKSGMAWRDV